MLIIALLTACLPKVETNPLLKSPCMSGVLTHLESSKCSVTYTEDPEGLGVIVSPMDCKKENVYTNTVYLITEPVEVTGPIDLPAVCFDGFFSVYSLDELPEE